MRIVRRLVHAVSLVLTLIVGITAAAVIVSQTAWFKNWLRGYIVREADQYLNGTLSIDRLGGNLFFGFEMENIGVSIDGSRVVAVRDLGLDYNVFELISGGLSVKSIRLDKPVVYLQREGDTWSIGRLLKKEEQEANRAGPARPISIDGIEVSDGSVVVDKAVAVVEGVDVPMRFDHLDAKIAFKYEPVRYSIEITHVSFRSSDPAIALNALSGGVSVRSDTVDIRQLVMRTAETSLSIDGAVQQYLTKPILNLQVRSAKLSLPEIARLVPALAGVKLQPAFELKLDGPLEQLAVEMNVRSSAGEVNGKIVADVLTPTQSAVGSLSIRHLDLAPIVNERSQKSDITADARIDLRGTSFSDLSSLRGSVSVDAPRIVAAGFEAGQVKANAQIEGRRVAINGHATAYGATATTAGLVTLPQRVESGRTSEIAFNLHGQARNIDLRRFPRSLNIPPANTNVNADYHVSGSAGNLAGDARFAPSTIAGATIAGGSTAAVTVKGEDIGYRADAMVSSLDLMRAGEEFGVPMLAMERYKSTMNGHVNVSGRGITQQQMDLTVNGTLIDTSIMGGHVPWLTFDVAMWQDTARLKANGSFVGFDPAVASSRRAMEGTVGGTLDVDATVTNVSSGLTVDSVRASATVNLEPSTIGGLEIIKAMIDGDYHDSTADIRTLDIVGRDVNVRGSGMLTLNETGQSNLMVHVDSPSLEQIGKLVNQPLTGTGKVDATVTGNRGELQVTGRMTADGVKYGGNGALTLSTDFTAKVPELDAANLAVSATTHGTLVTVAGQNINDLVAKTDYARQQVSFDATAKQPQRTLAVAGSLVLHPDRQEVHLQRLSLATQGMTWQTAAGSDATIQYADNAVMVENFKLANGDQQLAAEGTFGRPGDAFEVRLTNVDLAMVDALLLRPPQLSGRANAASTVTGTMDAPQVKADFMIGQGAFGQFHYDSFAGTVNYTGTAVVLDTKLQQNPTVWIEAKGRVPMALFKETGSSSSEPVELHLDSSPIDLGIVRGLTTVLTNVKGTLEAHVNVTGSASDPRPSGTIAVQDGAFTLEPTGVAYTGLDGRIDLQPDRVHIAQIRVLDNQRKPLTLTGDLAIHEWVVGGVSIGIKADDFKVIDNSIGNVRINSDLKVSGELNAPRVEGHLDVNTGVVNLDRILGLVGTSAYATNQTEFTPGVNPPPGTAGTPGIPGVPGNNDDSSRSAKSGALDALQIDVHLRVPDDLVIKANDLRAPGAPIGLGALNVTLGGDVYASRVPYDQIRLYGVVHTVRGTYDFQGRRFTILRDGTVRFEGLDDLDPVLDIRTERVIQAVTANVNVRGTLEHPEVALSSTPPLEQADILSLIVFNQPINQVGEGQQISLGQRAQQLATGAVAGELAKSIGNALNLDTFQISTAPDSGAAAELTIGQQLGQKLFVKVQQGIGEQSQTNFVLEYELSKWLRLQTNVLQGSSTQQQLFKRMQGSGVDLLFFFSY